MRPRTRPLAIALATAAGSGAVAVTTADRPAGAQAQPSAALAAGNDGRYQLQALPGGAREWVILDTRTGKVQHWSTDSEHYTVTTLEPGLKTGAGVVREVLTAPRD